MLTDAFFLSYYLDMITPHRAVFRHTPFLALHLLILYVTVVISVLQWKTNIALFIQLVARNVHRLGPVQPHT